MSDSKSNARLALVVEDRPSESSRIGQALEMLNIESHNAISIQDASSFRDDKRLVLVVLDLYLPPKQDPHESLDFMRDFRKSRPEVPIIILSVHNPRPEELRDVVSSRAGYFFRKAGEDFEINELTSLFQLALRGTVSYSIEIANSIPTLVEQAFKHVDPLTPREWSVLVLICQDLSTEAIADRLSITPAAVRSHKANIFDKLEQGKLINSRTINALCEWFKENRLKFRR